MLCTVRGSKVSRTRSYSTLRKSVSLLPGSRRSIVVCLIPLSVHCGVLAVSGLVKVPSVYLYISVKKKQEKTGQKPTSEKENCQWANVRSAHADSANNGIS